MIMSKNGFFSAITTKFIFHSV